MVVQSDDVICDVTAAVHSKGFFAVLTVTGATIMELISLRYADCPRPRPRCAVDSKGAVQVQYYKCALVSDFCICMRASAVSLGCCGALLCRLFDDLHVISK